MSIKAENKRVLYSFIYPFWLIVIIWLVKLTEYALNTDFSEYGLYPRKWEQIYGIFTMPFLHGDFKHLASNSMPFLVLGTALFYFYKYTGFKILFLLYIGTGIFTWITARPSYHIGLSGIVYGLAAFLVFAGFLSKNRALTAISFVVIFLYGSMIWGVLPGKEGVSWEGHLFGAVSGMLLAFWFAKDVVKPEIIEDTEVWEDEFSDFDTGLPHSTEINYEYQEKEE